MLGLKFRRRQQVVGGFVVDSYCAELRLALEIDGELHDSEEAMARDAERTRILQAHRVHVVRIRNADITATNLEALLSPQAQRMRPPPTYDHQDQRPGPARTGRSGPGASHGIEIQAENGFS